MDNTKNTTLIMVWVNNAGHQQIEFAVTFAQARRRKAWLIERKLIHPQTFQVFRAEPVDIEVKK